MKSLIVLATAYGVVLLPLSANAAPPSPAAALSLLEAAEIAAASGAYRVQNTANITTGRIRADDKKRSAIAFAISGAAAFVGAALWRWLPCRNQDQNNIVGGLEIPDYSTCLDADGNRKGWDTPTKALVGAGFTLELVSLGYLFAHLRSDDDN